MTERESSVRYHKISRHRPQQSILILQSMSSVSDFLAVYGVHAVKSSRCCLRSCLMAFLICWCFCYAHFLGLFCHVDDRMTGHDKIKSLSSSSVSPLFPVSPSSLFYHQPQSDIAYHGTFCQCLAMSRDLLKPISHRLGNLLLF